MTEFDPTSYQVLIQKQTVEGQPYFVGTVAEFPDVAVYEDTFEQAYEEIICILRSLQEAAVAEGRSIPEPTSQSDNFSGRCTLRMPKSLHRKVSKVADDEGVSLNQYLVAIVAEATGAKAARPSTPVIVNHIISQQTAIATSDVGTDHYMVIGTIRQEPTIIN